MSDSFRMEAIKYSVLTISLLVAVLEIVASSIQVIHIVGLLMGCMIISIDLTFLALK